MGAIDLTIAKEHLKQWLDADTAVSTGQSYTIGDRQLTRSNASEIRKNIEFWAAQVTKIENAQKNRGRNRLMRMVPRDL